MKNIFLFAAFLIVFFGFSYPVRGAYSVRDIKFCTGERPNDSRFDPYINDGRLIIETNCGQNFPKYDWRRCYAHVGEISETGISVTINEKVDQSVDETKLSDDIFDTVFDWCKIPTLFLLVSPINNDTFTLGLLSTATFFHVRGTRYINVGNLNQTGEFVKLLVLAYLNFLQNSGTVNYPIIHKGNGDPWFKFQQGSFANHPSIIGVIGDNFAMFANPTNRTQGFRLSDLTAGISINGYLYSNKNPNPRPFNTGTNNYITIEGKEAIFITTLFFSPVPTLTPTNTPTPVPTNTQTPTPTPPINTQHTVSVVGPTAVPSLSLSVTGKANEPSLFFKTFRSKSLLGLTEYLVFSAIYIMVIHFALAIKKEFNLFLMIGCFVLGGIIGWYQSWETGLIVAIVLSLIFY
jgi:hypothetical protein